MPRKKKQEEEAPEAPEEVSPAEQEETEAPMEHPPIIFNLPGAGDSETRAPKLVTLYGDIDEEKCAEAVNSMLMYNSTSQAILAIEDPPPIDPVKMYISTWGGSAADMFSVYDLVKSMRTTTPLHTVGLGKVMSAGVVLLACGEKGNRKIGANCRVMFHGVQAGHAGTIYNLENEMEEAKWTQKRYIEALVEETNMSASYLIKLIDRKLNVYFSAEQAIELGIADEII